MSLFKRALLYLTRKKGRSILLLIIIFLMSSFVLIGLALKFSADNETTQLRKTLGSSFNLEINTNNPSNYEPRETNGYTYQAYIGPVITSNLIDRIIQIDGVSNTTDSDEIVWANLNLFPGLYSDMYNDYLDNPPDDHAEMERVLLNTQTTMMLPCREGNLHTYFRNGAFEITEGRNIQKGDELKAVISTNLAERNGLSVGDTFVVESKEGQYCPSDEPLKTWGEPIELGIVGLFDVNFEQEPSLYTFETDLAVNLIFADVKSGKHIKSNIGNDPNEEKYGEVTFFVDNPQLLDTVMSQVESFDDIDWDYFTIKLDNVAYRASVKPLEQISRFSMFIIIASILGCVIILYLVLNMWMKNRKREMGVLMSIGVSKGNITFQFVVECILVVVIALIISFALSEFIIDGVGVMAENMVTPPNTSQAYSVTTEIGKGLTPIINKVSSEPIQLSYSLNLQIAMIMIVVTCCISIGSIILATMRIVRIKPKEILSTMS